MSNQQLHSDLARWGAWAGIAALICYFGAAFIPLPDALVEVMAMMFGPLLGLSFLGIYAAVRAHRNSVPLVFGTVMGVAAGVAVNLMLTVQLANNSLREPGDEAGETGEIIWRAVNQVQFSIDVSWDVFICAAGILVAVAMLRHPKFGKLFGLSGLVLALLLLVLNLYTFPIGPAYAGLIDVGPFFALWFLAVYVRILMLGPWIRSSGRAGDK